ncbi:PAP2-domain-containing protein [Polychaeton citri CBS 116435]|uniref:PAP2-domain-containing protein n=1 Tax=Polychaeton citri CBS 116435 TaxID=1314669 RepID=A0A9P4QJS4_9PEZI|nr:PAP2-domain-containing protein [Polychaeton citri CBS 116435]
MPTSDSGRNTTHKPERLRGSNNGSQILDSVQRFWQRSYAGDYLGLSILVVSYFIMKLVDEPFHQQFSLDDLRIQHPHAEVERVPVFMLFVYAAGIPLVPLALYNLALRPDLHKAHVTLLGLAITIFSTLFLTDVFKDAIGRPRPDLIARCKPRSDAPHGRLVDISICTESSHHLLHDGWRSFPSGHSSFSFAGLGWLSFFIASQTHAFRPGASLIVVALTIAPFIGAALIAISRLEDYRHDVFDVLVGSLLGVSISLFNWRRYWPGLRSSDCHEPYPPPTNELKGNISAGFQRVRDEEETFVGQNHR